MGVFESPLIPLRVFRNVVPWHARPSHQWPTTDATATGERMQARVRVKICGITRVEDADASVRFGADALGFMFEPSSPRYVEPQRAREIVATLPPFVSAVGVFVDPDPETVEAVLELVDLDALQFHGAESATFCQRFGTAYIKGIRMERGVDLAEAARGHPCAAAFLLDTYVPDKAGGTGQSFDWNLVPAERTKPIVLAGGLTAENVGAAIRSVRPYAVDVSGGVESARKGIKDPARLERFMKAVRGV
ncbi:MAG: phosphoribosylanthranilate isomerase [Gammaproteobacteria bacterium]